LQIDVFVRSLAGYPPFSPDRTDKPMPEQIQSGDYEHYLREPEWKSVSDDGWHIGICRCEFDNFGDVRRPFQSYNIR
jgi:hypothetical protein